jgi:hypothetical protein
MGSAAPEFNIAAYRIVTAPMTRAFARCVSQQGGGRSSHRYACELDIIVSFPVNYYSND